MSDLQSLLGGTAGAEQVADQSPPTDQSAQAGKPKRKQTPKTARILAREKATGTQAVWSDTDNGGRGGWVIPGLSEKMGGPAGTKAGQQKDVTDSSKQTDPALAEVAKLAENEKWSDAYTAINKLDQKKYADNPGYKQLYNLIKGKAGL